MDEESRSGSTAPSQTAEEPSPPLKPNRDGRPVAPVHDRQRRRRNLPWAARETPSPAITLVIVNHNDREHLHACLQSIPPLTDALVVDNGSTDGSVELVRANHAGVRMIADGTNPGYGAGANKGVHRCRTDYVMVLNSDTVLASDAPDTLRRYLDEHPRVALVGPQLLNPDGTPQPSVFPFPGTLRWLLENDPIAPALALVPGVRRSFYRYSPPTRAVAVPWVLGAVMAIRRDAFLQVGGFDESFFLYFEEVDLCGRLRAAGWEVHFVPATYAVHSGGATTCQYRAAMALEHFRSTLHFYRRHYRGARLLFWLTAMRTKMMFRALRDGLALMTTRNSGARARLRDALGVWRRALLQTGR